MQNGRKRDADRWDSLDLHFLRKYPEGSPERVIRFVEHFVNVPDGYGQGAPLRLRRWQQSFVRAAYADGIRVACFSSGRGNGKTVFGGAINLAELYTAAPGARLYMAASSERQAGRLMEAARDMVLASPELAARTIIYASKLEVRYSGATLETVPASSKSLQGLRPKNLTLDEAAEVDDATFEALSLSLGKIPDSRLICLSTAPIREDSFWARLREAGHAGSDETLAWTSYEAPEGSDPADPEVWRLANPAMGDFLDASAIASDLTKVRPEQFARYRLNQCTSGAGAFIPWGQFTKLAEPGRTIPPGTPVTLGFDGSVGSEDGNADSTVLVACTLDERPFVSLLNSWEQPAGQKGWKVDRLAVEAAVAAAVERWDVREIVCDPAHWRDSIQRWAERWGWAGKGGIVLEFATWSPTRMAPATDLGYQHIIESRLSWDGSEVLGRHVRNAVVKETSAGPAVVKPGKMSRHKVDGCVALLLALDRAVWHRSQKAKRYRVAAFS